MRYDIEFRVKAEGIDMYVPVGDCDANITWAATEIIQRATGLAWENAANNGLCKDVIPAIEAGLAELKKNGKAYKQYESPTGWGTVEATIAFFKQVLKDWHYLLLEYGDSPLVDVIMFWVV